MNIGKVILGDGLTVPGDIDPADLKKTLKKFLDDTPVVPLFPVSYKTKKNKYKVTLQVNGQTATITAINKA